MKSHCTLLCYLQRGGSFKVRLFNSWGVATGPREFLGWLKRGHHIVKVLLTHRVQVHSVTLVFKVVIVHKEVMFVTSL